MFDTRDLNYTTVYAFQLILHAPKKSYFPLRITFRGMGRVSVLHVNTVLFAVEKEKSGGY